MNFDQELIAFNESSEVILSKKASANLVADVVKWMKENPNVVKITSNKSEKVRFRSHGEGWKIA